MKKEQNNEIRPEMSRRGFLKLAAMTGAAMCIEPTLNKVSAAERALTGRKPGVKDIPAGMAAVRTQRTLGSGKAAFTVSAMGFGCMGLNHHRSQSPDEKACIRLVHEAIERGVDMFDCVMPTRNGRNGMLFTSEGIVNIRNQKWRDDFSPIDPAGLCFADTHYTKAYLRHLAIAGEMMAAQIASMHNLAFYLWLVGEARRRILDGSFLAWKREMVVKLGRRL